MSQGEEDKPLGRQSTESTIMTSESPKSIAETIVEIRDEEEQVPESSSTATIKKFPKLKHLRQRFQSVQVMGVGDVKRVGSPKLSVSFV